MEKKRLGTNNSLFKVEIFLMLILFSLGQSFAQEIKGKAHIPVDKNLDAKWVNSLFEKGAQKIYKGSELTYIAMPCGGIGAGQVMISGQGNLCFTESVYNQQQKANDGHGYSKGYQYLNPKKAISKIDNSFSVVIKEKNKASETYELNDKGFDDMSFTGEYPIAQLFYKKKNKQLPVEIRSEVFSPFTPLDVRNSANPVTVLKYTVKNISQKSIEVSILGWLKSISFPNSNSVRYVNQVRKSKEVTSILYDMQSLTKLDTVLKHAKYGNFALSVLDRNATYQVATNSTENHLKALAENTKLNSEKRNNSDKPIGGSLSASVKLKPNESKEITFLVSWYFSNYYENGEKGKYFKKAFGNEPKPGLVGHIYNNWYNSAYDAANYTATNLNTLYGNTKNFRDTYNDNSLPYWLSNRITMPVSTLAAGNISIWKNGRMYAYEGIGFCLGTCGHVFNFVSAIANLFPELERSVRLEQDFSNSGLYSGYSDSGRINFRGYGVDRPDAVHSYASDAQSGYVLKAYREHLMSIDNSFLDTVWEKVKTAIGYQIYKDGAEIGLEPNGVLECKQTFWDPMWYGPNPYNNNLYLAALRAAEEMAIIKGEYKLAKRYQTIFEKGKQYMDEKMWNGEFYVHLYPAGIVGSRGVQNGFTTPAVSDKNAKDFIRNFNKGEPNYYIGESCDAQQLFGQNMANQLGLGAIVPKEKNEQAAKSIFKYCWTPDISTVYNYRKPKHRTLAAKGEAAMVNAGWPNLRPKSYENTHDKDDVWTGLEYEASCDMINAGLLKEAFVSLRSIHDRYNGAKRNPWNEIEGSDHYTRAMHSWNVLLSLSGFTYDGPAGKLGFAPKLTPENFKSFFSSAEGWGNISQSRNGKKQKNSIEVKWGSLKLKQLIIEVPKSMIVSKVKAIRNGKSISLFYKVDKEKLIIEFDTIELIGKGSKVDFNIN